MWRFSDAELNCVSTNMRRMLACRQPLTGTSISRYLPPIGTAGFDRVAVSGNRRDPWPPPRMIASVSDVMESDAFCNGEHEGCQGKVRVRRARARCEARCTSHAHLNAALRTPHPAPWTSPPHPAPWTPLHLIHAGPRSCGGS